MLYVFGLLLILMLITVYAVVRLSKNTEVELECDSTLAKEVVTKVDESVERIRNGKIKKHVMSNDAEEPNPQADYITYKEGLEKKCIINFLNVKEKKYNG